jgi:hypothetical protein
MKKRDPTKDHAGYLDVLLWKDHGGCNDNSCSKKNKQIQGMKGRHFPILSDNRTFY